MKHKAKTGRGSQMGQLLSERIMFTHVSKIASFSVAILLTACSAPQESVNVSGSSTVLPVISKAAQAYSDTTGKRVIVNSGGSGVGFNQLAEGKTDIGMMSRDMTDEEVKQYPAHEFSAISIGIDAVVPVVSSEIYEAGVTALSLVEIASIYRGDVQNWSELGGPDRDILVIDKEASRGTRHIFMKVVMGDATAQAPGADLVLGANNEEQTAMAQSDAAIGMISLAWINDDVKGLAIEEGNRTIEANLNVIASGDYPISRDLIVVVRDDIKPEAKSFIDYLLSPAGQNFVEASGYIKINP